MILKLKDVRSHADIYHGVWYDAANKMAQSIGTDAELKRTQISNYSNATCDGDPVSTFFLRKVTIPLLDEVINEMIVRFDETTIKYIGAFNVIPSVIRKKEGKGDRWKLDLKNFMMDKIDDMDDVSTLNAEVDLWENRWKGMSTSDINENYATVQDLLDVTEPALYPNISRILELLAVFPPTTCTCERAISIIRRLKTPLRASMGQDRFSALALMMAHRDLKLDLDELIDRLATKYSKRLRMLYPVTDEE